MDNKEYSIVASAEAFDTLSSKLYTNPVAAIIRELSSNAYDSQVANGNVNKPFDLHIPEDGATYFSIRDYGEGMSNDFIMSVFTTYFASTKGNKDDQIGGFGLGSKTPYALVDEYYVTSFYEGKETKFKMFKRNGCPVVEKQSEKETNEPSGLMVEFDVSKDWSYYSNSKWYNEAVSFFSGFMSQPNWNLDLDENDLKKLALSKLFYNKESVEMSSDHLNIRHFDNYVTVNVAGVIYSVKGSIAGTPYPFERINIMADKNDVTVTPSREELHYDDKTIDYIVNNVNRVIQEKVKEIFDNIDNLSYDFTKLRKLADCRSDDAVEYNGQKIEEKATALLNSIFESKCYRLVKTTVKRQDLINSYSYHSWGTSDDTFVGILSRDGCKTAQLNTIKSTLVEVGEKVTSKAFCDRVRNFFKAFGKSPDGNDLLILFIKEGKEDIANKILNGEHTSYEIFKYANYANSSSTKKSSTRRGFITQGSIIYNDYVSFSGYHRSTIEPDVRDDEIPLVTSENFVSEFERYFPLLKIVKPIVNIVLRVCKEDSSISNICSQNKCENAIEWAKKVIMENKAQLNKYIKTAYCSNICSKVLKTRMIYDLDKYKEAKQTLLGLKLSKNAQKLFEIIDYVQENNDLITYCSLTRNVFKDECAIKPEDDVFSYERYPMLKYLDSGRAADDKQFCIDCLEYITSVDNR